jgi:hypothetical protein
LRAIAVLEEFIDGNGERLIEDPLKRAVLQRDLWWVETRYVQKERADPEGVGLGEGAVVQARCPEASENRRVQLINVGLSR